MSGHYGPVNSSESFPICSVSEQEILWYCGSSSSLDPVHEDSSPGSATDQLYDLKESVFIFLCSNLLSCEMEGAKFHDLHNPV